MGRGQRNASRTTAQPLAATRVEGATHLEARLDELSQEVSQLKTRLELISAVPRTEERAPVEGFITRVEFEALEDELRKLLEPQPEASVQEEQRKLKDQVAGALIEIRKQEAVDKVRDYQEQREERLDRDVEKITDWLNLSAYQEQGMRDVLRDQYAREAELTRLWEEGESDEVLGAMKAEARTTFQDEVRSVLTPEQAQTFLEGIGASKGE